MPKVSPIQSSFNTGELSPLVFGRVELDSYKAALALCLNHIPYVQGGLTRRNGTYFCDEVKYSNKVTRSIGFKFSTVQAYIIEFGDQYVRFKRNEGPVTETAVAITAVTRTNPVGVTAPGHTFVNGDAVDATNVAGMVELNNRRFTVANAAANTFDLLGVDGTAFTAYVSGGSVARVYEVATPYLEAHLFQLKFTQSADVLYITHPSYAPRQLSRTGHTAWTLTPTVFRDGPYLPVNTTATTITPSATTGSITLSASAPVFTLVTDVGRVVRIKHASTWGYARITAVASTISATATVVNAFAATTASGAWRLGLYSDTTGYPSCSTFFEDRLFYAGNAAAQQRLDGSVTGDYDHFAPTATDGVIASDNAVAATLNSDDVQFIYWMKGDEKGLFVGTSGGEWVVRASAQLEALSPTNIVAKQSTPHGSTNTQPVRAAKSVIYTQKSGRKLREFAYVYEVDGFRSPDLTLLSEHITRTGVKEIVYQQDPQSIVWGARNDGVLLGFTYERDQKVLGWHRHTLGGYSNSARTVSALVESVAVIPSPDGSYDTLWMVVRRSINGVTKRYNEFLTKLREQGDDPFHAFYLDSGLTYDGAPTTSISGLYHLAGETVRILADGATHPDVVVSATGTIALSRSASVVQVGFSYNSDGQALRLEAGAADGTAQGKTQRAHRVGFRLLDSLGLQVGPSFDKLTRLSFRSSAHNTAEAVPLFTGDKDDFTWEGDYTTANYVCWRWDQALPGTILALMPQLYTQDR